VLRPSRPLPSSSTRFDAVQWIASLAAGHLFGMDGVSKFHHMSDSCAF
jgi:hypothetical protein